MKYSVIISVGNTDNKLTQNTWALFCSNMKQILAEFECHFYGFPPGDQPWQNALWWVVVPGERIDPLRELLRAECRTFRQDSIAIVIGNTEMVSPL